MYEGHFNLRGRPFPAAPDPTRYFPAATIESARLALVRSIERGEGPGLIVAPPGTGKSLLCQILAAEFLGRLAIALVINGRFDSRTALLQAILHQLGYDYRGLEEGELRLALLDHLDPSAGGHEGLLLVVDEAHALPCKVLDEIRLLTNLVRDAQPRVRVVLAGNTRLEERFASPRLHSFNQRLAARCSLGPFDATETSVYIRAQIASVGGDADSLLDEEAFRAVYRVSDGIPRVVNQICDHALVLASVAGLRRLSEAVIEEAWADLQQLPAHWKAKGAEAPSSEVIEFGGLDEATEEQFTAIPFPASGSRESIATTAARRASEEFSQAAEPLRPSTLAQSNATQPMFGDPFSEQFEQEEIVLDRYAAASELFESRPRTASREGSELAEIFRSWTIVNDPSASASRVEPPPMPCHAAPQPPAADDNPTRAAAATLDTANHGAHAIPARPPSWRQLFSQGRLKQVSVAHDAPGLLAECRIEVIEDENPSPIIIDRELSRPAPLGRKREFRQLFAKLRRG